MPATVAVPRRAAVAPDVREHRGRVMGTDLHVLAVGTPAATAGAIARAVARLELLEARWSRFRPTSELARAATAAGTWQPVSADTVLLVRTALAAAERTDGRCDATGGAAIAAAGYDRDLAARRAAGPAEVRPARPFPGPGAVELDVAGRRLRLAPGCVLDAGAVGKGLAADLVVAELRTGPGAVPDLEGLLVNVGGDLAVAGRPPEGSSDPGGDDGAAWGVDVDLAVAGATAPATVRWSLTGGGVATSSSRRRTWDTTAGPAHHVLDPRTGAPAVAPPALVSVHAGAAWWAEAAATALMLMPTAERAAWARDAGVGAVIVTRDGAVDRVGDVDGRLA